ncbi:hypothetical protein ACVHNB_14055 [Streptomyces sp. YJ-C3]
MAGPAHPLAARDAAGPDDLLAVDFLVAEPGCTSEMLVDRFGRDLPADAQLSMVTGSLSAQLRLTWPRPGSLPSPASRSPTDSTPATSNSP